MKKWTVALLLSFGLCSVGRSEEMVPLNDFQMEGKMGLLYVMKRCAAVSLLMSGLIRNTENPAQKAEGAEMSAMLMGRYLKFSRFSLSVQTSILTDQGRDLGTQVVDEITNDIKAMTTFYQQEMDRSYQLTGKTISQLVLADTAVCAALTKESWYGGN